MLIALNQYNENGVRMALLPTLKTRLSKRDITVNKDGDAVADF